jgi:hypothetical protein
MDYASQSMIRVMGCQTGMSVTEVVAPIAAVNAPFYNFYKMMNARIGRINCHRLTESYNWL